MVVFSAGSDAAADRDAVLFVGPITPAVKILFECLNAHLKLARFAIK